MTSFVIINDTKRKKHTFSHLFQKGPLKNTYLTHCLSSFFSAYQTKELILCLAQGLRKQIKILLSEEGGDVKERLKFVRFKV